MNSIIRFATLFVLLIANAESFAQTETFDIIKYTPPRNWKKEAKPGVINYIDVNEAAGKFCVITMYVSSSSTGDGQADFKREWKHLVATPYKATLNPKTETQITPDGWKAIVGAASVKQDGTDVLIALTVMSGFGKTVSIRTSMNDQSYTAQIDALFETMELDTTKIADVVINNTATVQTSTGKGTFGLMTYTAPAGWSEQKFSDGVVFKPLDLPSDQHLAVHIMIPLNSPGTLEQAMEQSFDEAAAMYKATRMYQAGGNYGKNASQKSFKSWNYIRGKGGIQVENGTPYKIEKGLELFVIKINNRFERVAILESRNYCGGVSRYYTTDRVSYRSAIENLLFSLQFNDFNATVLPSGLAKGTGVTGVWRGIIQSTSTPGFDIQTYSPIFLTNGQVYFGRNLPTEGLDELNTRILAELNKRDWGTYTFSNGAGIMKMPYGDIPFRSQGDKLIVTKNQTDWSFYKLNSVDGAKFSGTYKMSLSYGKIPVITFTADGKFDDNGVVGTLYHNNTECVNPGSKPGSGTYHVKDYTITFNYTNGRKVKFAFLGTDYDKANPSPPVLRMSYNDDQMQRQ